MMANPSVSYDPNSDWVIVRYRTLGGYLNRWMVRQEIRIPGMVYQRYGLSILAVHPSRIPVY